MSGTRKLEKFELEAYGVPSSSPPSSPPSSRGPDSGTQKLEKFVPPGAQLSIPTPLAEISPLVLAKARPSDLPPASSTSGMIAREQRPEGNVAEPQSPRSERARNREPDVERLRTRLARKFTTLADEVTEAFADFRIGAGAWTVELTAPDGMSTKGGRHALQHLRLRPTRQGFSVLVGGIVNAVGKTSELRDYEHIQAHYHARFGRDLEITAGEWEQFLRKAEVVLRDEGLATTRVPAPRDLAELSRHTEGNASKRRAAIATLAVVLFAASIVVWRVIVALLP